MTTALAHDSEVAFRFDGLAGRFKREVGPLDCRLEAILDRLPSTSTPRVLDLGCGKGRFARRLEGRGYRVVGVDLSARMLEEATGLDRVKATAGRLPFGDAAFDAVIAVETLQHVGDVATVLDEACRVLRPGGRLIVIDKNALSLNAQRPWLPSLLVKWIDERRGRWMYPAGGPVRERWFPPTRFARMLARRFASVSIHHPITESEARRFLFRRWPSARLLACWTATTPGGDA